MTNPKTEIPAMNRAIFLGDIENLAWDRTLDTLTIASIRKVSNAVEKQLRSFAPLEVIASSHYFAKQIWFAWGRDPRRLLGSGQDGADLQIIKLIKEEHIYKRFNTVIIGSGDGIFAHPASHLAKRGITVLAAYGSGGLSKKLHLIFCIY